MLSHFTALRKVALQALYRLILRQIRLSVCPSHSGIVSKRGDGGNAERCGLHLLFLKFLTGKRLCAWEEYTKLGENYCGFPGSNISFDTKLASRRGKAVNILISTVYLTNINLQLSNFALNSTRFYNVMLSSYSCWF